MKAYDFDKTILKGNSICRFFLYCLVRFPYLLLFLPIQGVTCLLYFCKLISKDKQLQILESFIAFVPKKQKTLCKFWDKNFKHVQSWYLQQRESDDLIISASPLFVVQEACRRLGVQCIASDYDVNAAKLNGRHCYGYEKVVQYKAMFGDKVVDEFYSDSLSDLPMLKLAKKGYLVKGDKVTLCYLDGKCVIDIDEERYQNKLKWQLK